MMRPMSDVVALLSRLIAVDTRNPSGNEPQLARACAELLRAAEPDELRVVDVPRDGGRSGTGAYVVARWGRPRLLLNAHLDTVPVNAGWSSDPFSARVDGGRVYGLGACDTKGAIAAILSALSRVRPRDLAIAFTGDEEHGGSCIHALLARERRGPLATVERAIVCEPTSCRAGTRHRGVLAIEAYYSGRGGHSSRADDLPAPLADAARLAVAYAEWGRRAQQEGPAGFQGMCLNIAKLDGGVAFNVVPDEARLMISVRPPPGTDVEKVRDDLFGLAGDITPDAQLSAPVANPSFVTLDVRRFGTLAMQSLDLAFWTEAALLVAAGIDAVVFGPGDIAQAHAPDEYVPIDELERARDTFVAQISEAHGAG
jgi:acetylornithine deacetylase